MKWTNTATGKSIEIFNEDCMPALEKMQENEFELAIVDPPYGIDINKSGRLVKEKGWEYKEWDKNVPNDKYFSTLKEVSENQIIWGGNYFNLGTTRCYLIWDKKQPEGVSFASSELAWTSFDKSTKTFYWHPQHKNEERQHPTQKPIALYKWLLKNYAQPNDRILDTHLGSGSIAIACWDMGFDLVGYELDKDYFEATCKRLNDHFNQQTLF